MQRNGKLMLLTAMLGLASFAANACMCPPPPPAKEAARRSDLVFVGRVVSVQTHESSLFAVWVKDRLSDIGDALGQDWQRDYSRDSWREATFEIAERFKGPAVRKVAIDTGWGAGDCGVPVVVGESYLVFARHLGERNAYVTGSCDGTREAKRSHSHLAALRGGI